MLPRYSLKEMQDHWSLESKFRCWHTVEAAVLNARASHGQLDLEVAQAIGELVTPDVDRIYELEAIYHHDLLAFVTMAQEQIKADGLGPHKEQYHYGLTSYDVEDPAMILMLRRAIRLIMSKGMELQRALYEQALKHQWTLMIAHTHGQFAQPSTFGHWLMVKCLAVQRGMHRLERLLEWELAEAKISGAVGNYGTLTPEIERTALGYLGLKPAIAETQILQRDRHAAVVAALAIVAATIEDISRTFHVMMRSEVGELQEPRSRGQRGSSAMAHKRNPHRTEQLIGLARLVRGMVAPALENVSSLDWRDISHSSVERHILPDITSLVHYMCHSLTSLVRDLVVFPEGMAKNLSKSRGVWATQAVMNALMRAGVPHEVAYPYVQQVAFAAFDGEMQFAEALKQHPIPGRTETITELIGEIPFIYLFDARAAIAAGIEHIFAQGDEAIRSYIAS